MNTYWVYENIKEQSSFYNKLDTLLLLSSVYLWKKHHPNFTTNLTVDKLTYDYLHNINATYLWDKVEILPKNTFINKSIMSFCNKYKLINPVIMGCSMGGRVVLHLALEQK